MRQREREQQREKKKGQDLRTKPSCSLFKNVCAIQLTSNSMKNTSHSNQPKNHIKNIHKMKLIFIETFSVWPKYENLSCCSKPVWFHSRNTKRDFTEYSNMACQDVWCQWCLVSIISNQLQMRFEIYRYNNRKVFCKYRLSICSSQKAII